MVKILLVSCENDDHTLYVAHVFLVFDKLIVEAIISRKSFESLLAYATETAEYHRHHGGEVEIESIEI